MQKSSKRGTLLLYNIEEQPYAKEFKLLSLRLGFRIKPIASTEYEQPLGTVLNLKDFVFDESKQYKSTPSSATTFTDAMIIFHGVTNTNMNILLRELKKQHISIPLKAIVTPHNIHWSSLQLHRELMEERAKFEAMEQNK